MIKDVTHVVITEWNIRVRINSGWLSPALVGSVLPVAATSKAMDVADLHDLEFSW